MDENWQMPQGSKCPWAHPDLPNSKGKGRGKDDKKPKRRKKSKGRGKGYDSPRSSGSEKRGTSPSGKNNVPRAAITCKARATAVRSTIFGTLPRVELSKQGSVS